MPRSRAPKSPSQGYLVWLTIQDTPASEEDYYSQAEIVDMLRMSLNAWAGIRVTRFSIQALPKREKARKIDVSDPSI